MIKLSYSVSSLRLTYSLLDSIRSLFFIESILFQKKYCIARISLELHFFFPMMFKFKVPQHEIHHILIGVLQHLYHRPVRDAQIFRVRHGDFRTLVPSQHMFHKVYQFLSLHICLVYVVIVIVHVLVRLILAELDVRHIRRLRPFEVVLRHAVHLIVRTA